MGVVNSDKPVVVDTSSDYYVPPPTPDPSKCIEINDSLSVKCIKVSNDAYEKCIEITADVPYISITPDTTTTTGEQPCEIPDRPEISLVTINGLEPVELENLEILESDPFGKYPDLKKHYVKDYDKVVYQIDNIDKYENITDVYVYTDKDNVGWLFDKPSNFATYNEEDKTIELDVKDQLDGVDLELWVWVKDGECWSDGGIYIVETMERSHQPVLNGEYYINSMGSSDITIYGYNEDNRYNIECYLENCINDNYSYSQEKDIIHATAPYVDDNNGRMVVSVTLIEPFKYESFRTDWVFSIIDIFDNEYKPEIKLIAGNGYEYPSLTIECTIKIINFRRDFDYTNYKITYGSTGYKILENTQSFFITLTGFISQGKILYSVDLVKIEPYEYIMISQDSLKIMYYSIWAEELTPIGDCGYDVKLSVSGYDSTYNIEYSVPVYTDSDGNTYTHGSYSELTYNTGVLYGYADASCNSCSVDVRVTATNINNVSVTTGFGNINIQTCD